MKHTRPDRKVIELCSWRILLVTSTTNRLLVYQFQGEILSIFKGKDNIYRVYDCAITIDSQETVSGTTCDQLIQLVRTDLPINKNDFIRMWKTLLFKRVQDVYEKEKYIRSEDIVRLDNSILTQPHWQISSTLWEHSLLTRE